MSRADCMRGVGRGALAIGLAACPIAARAHLVTTGIGPVYDGIAHFAVSFQDLIPVLALGLYAGQRGRDHARAVTILLPLAWLIGGATAALTGQTTVLQLGWLPFLLLGGLVAADVRLPRWVTAALALLLGGLLGQGNGVAMSGGPVLRALLGVSAAAFVATTLLAATVVSFQVGWQRIAWRVAGSWIAAAGLLMLGWSFAV